MYYGSGAIADSSHPAAASYGDLDLAAEDEDEYEYDTLEPVYDRLTVTASHPAPAPARNGGGGSGSQQQPPKTLSERFQQARSGAVAPPFPAAF